MRKAELESCKRLASTVFSGLAKYSRCQEILELCPVESCCVYEAEQACHQNLEQVTPRSGVNISINFSGKADK